MTKIASLRAILHGGVLRAALPAPLPLLSNLLLEGKASPLQLDATRETTIGAVFPAGAVGIVLSLPLNFPGDWAPIFQEVTALGVYTSDRNPVGILSINFGPDDSAAAWKLVAPLINLDPLRQLGDGEPMEYNLFVSIVDSMSGNVVAARAMNAPQTLIHSCHDRLRRLGKGADDIDAFNEFLELSETQIAEKSNIYPMAEHL